MNIAVVVYSLTGNNAKLAKGVSKSLGAAYIEIQPEKPVSNGTIFKTLLFGGVPKSTPEPAALASYDKLVFVAPVWMGMAAFPLRPYLSAFGKTKKPYGFLSVSGGADGGNPKIKRDLYKRVGYAPVILLDQNIRSLLPAEPAPTREMTSAYRLTEADLSKLTQAASAELARSGLFV
ncbi:MAG: hypothetical protein ABFD03_00655 [Clostridiaceae bacterium]